MGASAPRSTNVRSGGSNPATCSSVSRTSSCANSHRRRRRRRDLSMSGAYRRCRLEAAIHHCTVIYLPYLRIRTTHAPQAPRPGFRRLHACPIGSAAAEAGIGRMSVDCVRSVTDQLSRRVLAHRLIHVSVGDRLVAPFKKCQRVGMRHAAWTSSPSSMSARLAAAD